MDNERTMLKPAERRDPTHLQMATQVIQALESIDGVSVPDKAGAADYLASPAVLTDKGGIVRFISCDDAVPTVGEDLVRLRTSAEFSTMWSAILKNQLLNAEYRERTLGPAVEIIEAKKVEIPEWNATIDTATLDTLGMGIDEIKTLVSSVIDDQDSTAEQGVFWNVLISKNKPYVVKTERDMSTQHQAASRDLLAYSVVSEAFGSEYLPKQVVLKDASSDQLCVVQEKLNLGEMMPLSNGNIDDFLEGRVGGDIREALRDGANNKKMRDFIAAARLLLQEHNLSLDTLGENIYFSVAAQGELQIKIADYGCFERGKQDDRIQEVEQFFKKLESIL